MEDHKEIALYFPRPGFGALGGRRVFPSGKENQMKRRIYVAYGSNLNLPQMRFRCPDAKPVGTAFIDDYRLMFRGSLTGSYLTIEKKKGYRVPVALWEVSVEDEKSLDRYEGYPRFYKKQDFTFSCKSRKTEKEEQITAFAYVMAQGHTAGIPTGSYMETCLEGYDSFGFDSEYLFTAYEESEEEAFADEK